MKGAQTPSRKNAEACFSLSILPFLFHALSLLFRSLFVPCRLSLTFLSPLSGSILPVSSSVMSLWRSALRCIFVGTLKRGVLNWTPCVASWGLKRAPIVRLSTAPLCGASLCLSCRTWRQRFLTLKSGCKARRHTGFKSRTLAKLFLKMHNI